MTSSVKSGFSTINRLLGKRSKDDIPVDPHITTRSSGSPTSLFSKSMSNLDTSSQYNKIVPLAAMSNAPFEQTFRITIALPRGQLFVVRVGAKSKLGEILDMTCTAKQLDRDKYEFRHPTDSSMVFANGLTIGEVGLNEIRLAPVSERRQTSNTFSSEELERMRAGSRNSYAAPSLATTIESHSLRNGQSPNKSQYSSMNSLNSIESAVVGGQRQPPVAPMRKKRAAPRPPSQNVIPEDESALRQMSFHVSSPNLSHNLSLSLASAEDQEDTTTPHKHNGTIRPVSMFPAAAMESPVNGSTTDLTRGVSRTSSTASDMIPRPLRRKKAAPAAPQRLRDSLVPQPAPRTMTPVPQQEGKDSASHTVLNTPLSAVEISFEDGPKDISMETSFTESSNTAIVTDIPIVGEREPQVVITPEPSLERDQMNIYNLNTGKCVEGAILAEQQETNSAAIQERSIDQVRCSDEDREKPQLEDLYAEVKKPVKKIVDTVPVSSAPSIEQEERRPDSPTWTYTLPAPVVFGDSQKNNLLITATEESQAKITATEEPEEEAPDSFGEYNYDDTVSTVADSVATTVVTDVIITPIIQERITMMLDQPMMLPLHADTDQFHSHSESSDFNSSSTLTSVSPNNLHGDQEEQQRKRLIINSDNEDGYHGPQEHLFVNQGLIANLEKRRDKFIENELEQLVNESTPLHLSHSRHQEFMYGDERKDTAAASVEEEPTISASPIEDGLPAGVMNHQSATADDSGKDSEMFGDSSEEYKEERSQISQSNLSFEERRNSFLADLESSKNLFTSKGSELSISDESSSLHSLQVMRSILSTQSVRAEEERKEDVQSVEVEPKKNEEEEENKTKAATEIDKEKSTIESEKKDTAPVPKPIVVETKPWKYTGPPKINLGSWTERPKVQVSLKTDSDYHHSRQRAAEAAAAAAKAQTQAQLGEILADSDNKLATKEHEKDSEDIVRPIELKKTISVQESPAPAAEPIFVAKEKFQRPISMFAGKYTPIVRGFPMVRPKNEDDPDIRSTQINPVLKRSDSNVVAKARNSMLLDNPAPFSQSTLKRTGLKEKILASPKALEEPVPVRKDAEEEPQLRVSLKPVVVESSVAKEIISSPVKESPSTPPPPPPPLPTGQVPVRPAGLLNPLARLVPVSQQNTAQEAQKPIVRAMVVKKKMQPREITPEVDPRAQLLDSIRNFSFNSRREM